MTGQSEVEPGVVGPGQGHQLTARGSVMAFKAVAAQTGGDFSLMERTLPPGDPLTQTVRESLTNIAGE